MFERVLVPVDGGPHSTVALNVGRRMAELWGARLDVLGFLEHGINIAKSEKAVEVQTAHLRTVADVSMRTVAYTVGDDIADEIESEEHTLVVMATSARSRTAALVDSVADDVLRGITSAALLLGPNAQVPDDWPTGPMFVCTDGSRFSEEIIPHAATFAEGLKLEPWVIAVSDPSEVPASIGPAMETNYTARVAASFTPMVGKEVNYDVLHGQHPAKDIVEYANNHDAALIAMATHGHTGLKRLAMGSVAMGVVHDAHCPVLVSRPQT